jgi:hypothetical protein
MTNELQTQPQAPLNEITREVLEYTHRQKAIRKLKKSSIKFPVRPDIPGDLQDADGDFAMPKDITTLNSLLLGQLMSILNGMLQWYGAVLASSKVDKLTAERVKNFTEAKVRMEIMSDKQMMKDYKAREDKDAYVNINELVQEAQDWFDSQEALVIMTEQIYKDLERSYSLVSREITRRGGDFNRELREGNLK